MHEKCQWERLGSFGANLFPLLVDRQWNIRAFVRFKTVHTMHAMHAESMHAMAQCCGSSIVSKLSVCAYGCQSISKFNPKSILGCCQQCRLQMLCLLNRLLLDRRWRGAKLAYFWASSTIQQYAKIYNYIHITSMHTLKEEEEASCK